MARTELETLVQRMNELGRLRYKGFICCFIFSHKPTILAYDFDSGLDADSFILTRQMEESEYKMEHAPDNEIRILEYR